MTAGAVGSVAGGGVLAPVPINSLDDDLIVAISNQGRMLIFPVLDLPIMARGKGNKMINIPSAKFKSGDEFMQAVTVMSPADALLVYAGKRHLSMKLRDLEHYIGERARRGNKLPRGFQKVDRVALEKKRADG